MDFTLFVKREAIPALSWLGRRDWLDAGYGSFEQRSVWTRPKSLDIELDERRKYPKEHWDTIEEVVKSANRDVVHSFLLDALSKSIAGGPKVFQPTYEDCEALENTACTMTFDEYKQPYPVVIIEFPKAYREHLAEVCGQKHGPSHVIVHHDIAHGFVNVHAFYNRDNIISHITPARKEYKTIEDAILRNQGNRDIGEDVIVAELAQRLAVNFCMVMVLIGVRQTQALNPDEFSKHRKMAKSKNPRQAILGRKLVESTMFKIEFIQQKIKLYEEEFVEPRPLQGDETPEDRLRASPKPHWRRGHYRQQRYGTKLSETKLVFIKPVLVRKIVFGGDQSKTETIYKITTRGDHS